jgi:nitrogen fixation/metabolism regulation signal transduction histidine kinase
MRQETLIHDMKNVMMLMDLFIKKIDQALTNNDTEIAKKYVAKMGTKISVLIQDFHDLLSGQNTIKEENVAELIKQICSDAADLYNITIEVESYFHSSQKLHLTKFRNAIINIIKNASESTSTKLVFSISKDSMLIQDNGSGFPDEVLASFNNNSKINSTKELGNGEGLQSVKDVFSAFDWDMKLKNTKKGALIKVWF